MVFAEVPLLFVKTFVVDIITPGITAEQDDHEDLMAIGFVTENGHHLIQLVADKIWHIVSGSIEGDRNSIRFWGMLTHE